MELDVNTVSKENVSVNSVLNKDTELLRNYKFVMWLYSKNLIKYIVKKNRLKLILK